MPPMLRAGDFYGHSTRALHVGELTLVESHHAAGSRLARHTHERAYFCLNFGGRYAETYGRRRRLCEAGMLVFHPPGESHSEVHESAVSSLNVEIGPLWLHRLREFGGTLDQPMEFRTGRVIEAGQALLRVLRHGADTLAIESLCWEIVGATACREQSRCALRVRAGFAKRANS